MVVKTEIISASPAAVLRAIAKSFLVQMSEGGSRGNGIQKSTHHNTGSNNSSAALRAGIPSISTGAGPCSVLTP